MMPLDEFPLMEEWSWGIQQPEELFPFAEDSIFLLVPLLGFLLACLQPRYWFNILFKHSSCITYSTYYIACSFSEFVRDYWNYTWPSCPSGMAMASPLCIPKLLGNWWNSRTLNGLRMESLGTDGQRCMDDHGWMICFRFLENGVSILADHLFKFCYILLCCQRQVWSGTENPAHLSATNICQYSNEV